MNKDKHSNAAPENPEPNNLKSTALAESAKNLEQAKLRAIIEKQTIPRAPANKQREKMSDSFARARCQNYGSGGSPWKVLEGADSTKMKPNTWVLQDWIPENKITALVGAPGTGKTTLSIAIAAALSNGVQHCLWDGQAPSGFGSTIISLREDDYAGTVLPRYIVAGGNRGRIKSLKGVPTSHPLIPFHTRPCNFSDADNAIWLKEAQKLDYFALMILDPVSQVVNADASSNSKARKYYEKFAQTAEDFNFAVLGIGHTVKNTKGKGIYALMDGPGALGQVARSIIVAVKIKSGPLNDGATHILILAKPFGVQVNYGVTYSIEACEVVEDGVTFETSRIKWHGIIPGTPEELITWAEGGEASGKVTGRQSARPSNATWVSILKSLGMQVVCVDAENYRDGYKLILDKVAHNIEMHKELLAR